MLFISWGWEFPEIDYHRVRHETVYLGDLYIFALEYEAEKFGATKMTDENDNILRNGADNVVNTDKKKITKKFIESCTADDWL